MPSGHQRNTNVDNNENEIDEDYEYFIVHDIPTEQIRNMLKLKDTTEKEIDETIDKIQDVRKHIKKVIKKFINKINAHIGYLDIPELIKKGMKYAQKYGLNSIEKKAFYNYVLKKDIYNEYTYMGEIKSTEMSKFFGFDSMQGNQMIKIQPKDHSKLNELALLYESTKLIHANVKDISTRYKDCAMEALDGEYDKKKHNVSVHIHPLIVSIFLPKIQLIERKMLFANIARIVLSRAQAYLRNYNYQFNYNTNPNELNAEFELAYDIARDPNALAYFKDDTPIDNIIKRYRCQVELWQTVSSLRTGRYYSTGYDENDGISGFLRAINSYDWTFFDSPDFYYVQDEGTILRKLLAIFSFRPTYVQLSSFVSSDGVDYNSISRMSRTKFINTPMINLQMPRNITGNQQLFVRLEKSLSQVTNTIENKYIVPKQKDVVWTNNVVWFYANRRYPTTTFLQVDMSLRCVNIPTSFTNPISVNKTSIYFPYRINIGKDYFILRSVVLLLVSMIPNVDISLGSTAVVIKTEEFDPLRNTVFGQKRYVYYDPIAASIRAPQAEVDAGNAPYQPPMTYLEEQEFESAARERGTIFYYVKLASPFPC